MASGRIGVTGTTGLIGRHLLDHVLAQGKDVIAIDLRARGTSLEDAVASCNTVVHLAGVNRGDERALERTNIDLATKLRESARGASVRVVYASTTREREDTPYGRGKLGARMVLEEGARAGDIAALRTMVIPNVFGAHGRPFHNSVVATFCHQLTHGATPEVIIDATLPLVYVNPLVRQLTALAGAPWTGAAEVQVPAPYSATVTGILAVLQSFHHAYYETRVVPSFRDAFERDLWATFMTFMEDADHLWHPQVHADPRGSLFELVRGGPAGQVFMSTSRPGVLRGNHYHTRKLERFCVVRGTATIRLRRIDRSEITEFSVSGEDIAIVEIPIFHTHNIENIGPSELLTLFWANEVFDAEDPDTFALDVAAPPRNPQ